MKGKFSIVFSIILALGILLLLGYKDDSINITPSYRTSSMRGIHLNHKEGNSLKWELFAREATFPEDKKDILIDSLELKIHNEPAIYITGGTGSYNLEEKTLDIRDKIELNLKNGVFRTESLRWDGREGRVSSSNDVEFTSDNFTINGTGLVADIDEEEIRILKNVKGTFYR